MPKASTNCFYVGDLPGVQASASVSPTRARFSANPPKPRKSRAKTYRPANTYCSPITPLTTYDTNLLNETPDNEKLSYSLSCTPAAATAPSSSTTSSFPQAPRGFVDETIDCRPIPRMRRVKRSAEDKLKDVLDVDFADGAKSDDV
ncbi:hypothetical protein GGF50DRAFT_88566 [Schizophyllum commune]